MNRAQALAELELLENYEFDRGDAPVRLLEHMSSRDLEVLLTAIRACSGYLGLPGIWERLYELAVEHTVEEVRAASNAALWPVMQDGSGWDWTPSPEDLPEPDEDSEEQDFTLEISEPQVPREVYEITKRHLLGCALSRTEGIEVRRRSLEALGHIGFLPEVRELILQYYREAPSPMVKVSALYAMGLQEDEEFERIVLSELESPHNMVLVEAIHASASMGLEEAWPIVSQLPGHEDPDIHFESVAATGLLAPLEQAARIIEQLAEEYTDPDSREALEIARMSLQERIAEESGEDDGWRMEQVWDEIDRMTDSTITPDDDDESGDDLRPGRTRR